MELNPPATGRLPYAWPARGQRQHHRRSPGSRAALTCPLVAGNILHKLPDALRAVVSVRGVDGGNDSRSDYDRIRELSHRFHVLAASDAEAHGKGQIGVAAHHLQHARELLGDDRLAPGGARHADTVDPG